MSAGLRRAIVCAFVLVPTAALAHPGHGNPNPFHLHGLADQLGGLDYALAAIAAGLALAVALTRRARRAQS